MNRISKVLACFVFVLAVAFAAHSQSVADAARSNKATQKSKASKTYTNEDIPSVQEPAPAEKKDAETTAEGTEAKDGESPEAKSEEKAEANGTPAKDKAEADANKTDSKEQSADDEKRLAKEWNEKVSAQKQKIADLEKQQQLTDREYKLRAAVFYADAGNRLRDDKKWSDQEQKYKADMAKLDQDLKSAKDQLETMREQARKAGVKVD